MQIVLPGNLFEPRDRVALALKRGVEIELLIARLEGFPLHGKRRLAFSDFHHDATELLHRRNVRNVKIAP